MPLKNNWPFKELLKSLLEALTAAMRRNMKNSFLVLKEVLEPSTSHQGLWPLDLLEIWCVLKGLSPNVSQLDTTFIIWSLFNKAILIRFLGQAQDCQERALLSSHEENDRTSLYWFDKLRCFSFKCCLPNQGGYYSNFPSLSFYFQSSPIVMFIKTNPSNCFVK